MHLRNFLFIGLVASATARVLSRSLEDEDKKNEDNGVDQVGNANNGGKALLVLNLSNNNRDSDVKDDEDSDDKNLDDKDSDDNKSNNKKLDDDDSNDENLDDKDSDDNKSNNKKLDDDDSGKGKSTQDDGNASFGKCSPAMSFKKGRPGRKADEGTFLPDDSLVAEGQQDALNPNIITNRICDQLGNVCEANDAGIKKCLEAKEKISVLREESIQNGDKKAGDAKNEEIAAAWNDALGA